MKVVKHRNKFSRKDVETPSLQLLKDRLDGALSNLPMAQGSELDDLVWMFKHLK